MNEEKTVKLGDVLYADIENNDYLNELYKNILYNYAIQTMHITHIKQARGINVKDALRFADILSKSTHPENADKHKIWAQEIITLLMALYPDNKLVAYYAGSVLTSTGNFLGLDIVKSPFQELDAMDRLYSMFSEIYLTVPADRNKRFFQAQKEVYDHLSDECFSYSAPTSMGKSFVMRMFIKAQILSGIKMNFALIVPTKALINEVRSEIIKKDLAGLLEQYQYHVISAASDMALEIHPDHNFILVMTPERLLYLMSDKKDFRLDYLFVDEAHKMTGRNSRAPFYYSVVDELCRKDNRPHFVFASPNIPNPEVYLKLIASGQYDDQNATASAYSPVAQFKFLVNLKTEQVSIYNDHLKTQEYICRIMNIDGSIVPLMWHFDKADEERAPQMIAYFSSKDNAITAARKFETRRSKLNDKELDTLAADVRKLVHNQYFLADLLEKGIAYHIGYLPTSIRQRIEKLFKEGKITAMFCTSTLVEGVNLPADDLFVTTYYNGRSQMGDVDFRNLVGRVGRIQYNLSGNVFLVSDESRNNKQEVYLQKLKNEIPDQNLSVVQDLKPKHKKRILETLRTGSSVIDRYNDTQPEEEYIMMRKFALKLLQDILKDNDSLVRQEFQEYMQPGDEDLIRQKFSQYVPLIDSDINISIDQTRRLRAALRADDTLKFPDHTPGTPFDVEVVRDFLIRLGEIFDWKRYEYNTLGKCDGDGDYTKLRWYAVILAQWMEGKGLNNIMRRAITYQENHPDKFWINKYTKQPYIATSLEHKNIVFANTLEVIENIILFSISNYFLRFANEYMKIHGEESLATGNWYEYVEYGTTNEVMIQLQRYGFSREAALYIREHQDDYVNVMPDKTIKVRWDEIQKCTDPDVQRELEDIHLNTPELFTDYEEVEV